MLAGTAEELVSALRAVAAGDAPPPATAPDGNRGPVWVFSGQGSQWSAMGAALLSREPQFAAAIAEIPTSDPAQTQRLQDADTENSEADDTDASAVRQVGCRALPQPVTPARPFALDARILGLAHG